MKILVKLGSLNPLVVPSPGAAEKIVAALNSDAKVIPWDAAINIEYVAETADELRAITAYNGSKMMDLRNSVLDSLNNTI